MKRTALILFIFLALFKNGKGCGCAGTVGYNEAKIVFTGKVIKVRKKGPYEIHFKIREVEKGKVRSKKMIVYTPCLVDACCGIGFKINQLYRVFAYDRNEKLYTDACTETTIVRKTTN